MKLKGEAAMYKIKKLTEANHKIIEIEKKIRLNTIGWNLRPILSLRASRNCNVM